MGKSKKFFTFAIVCAICGLAFIGIYSMLVKSSTKHDERSNTECLSTQRVFDYIDKLDSGEEGQLNNSIEEIEQKYGMDFVVVIIDDNTDLSNIGYANASFLSSSVIAEAFCNTYMFGWESWDYGGPVNGRIPSASAIIVANWDSGDAWMCTSGKVLDRISDSKASKIVQDGCQYLRADPLKGFTVMIDGVDKAMRGRGHGIKVPFFITILLPIIIAIIFFVANFSKKAGNKTTTASTYSRDGKTDLLAHSDVFINRKVTSVRINTSSGGHGGGHGGGGHSGGHGGGGGHF